MPITPKERDKIMRLAVKWNQARVDWHYASLADEATQGKNLARAKRAFRAYLNSLTSQERDDAG